MCNGFSLGAKEGIEAPCDVDDDGRLGEAASRLLRTAPGQLGLKMHPDWMPHDIGASALGVPRTRLRRHLSEGKCVRPLCSRRRMSSATRAPAKSSEQRVSTRVVCTGTHATPNGQTPEEYARALVRRYSPRASDPCADV